MKKQFSLKNYTLCICTCLMAALFPACQDDSVDGAESAAKELAVTLAIHVPGSSLPSTRALTGTQENDVTTIDVLVFDATTKVYTHTAQAQSGGISSSDTDGRKKSFTVTLQHGSWDIVILANARAALAATTLTGQTKTQIYENLIYTLPATNPKWAADGNSPFPMWGDVGENVTINAGTDLSTTPTNLHRMVARVDVKVDAAVSTTTFELNSVRVYNYNTNGTIVPDLSSSTTWDSSTPKALFPHVLSTFSTTQGPLIYENTASSTIISSNACTQEIYILEAENVSASNTVNALTNRTCLVIGGFYDSSTTETYYRVDFYNDAASQPFLNILRNHQYIFNITSVTAPGFGTPGEAFNSEPANISAGVLVWDISDINDIVFNNQYSLGVSPAEFNLSGYKIDTAGDDNYITVLTDFVASSGNDWNIVGPYDATDGTTPISWLTFHDAAGVAITGGSVHTKTKVYLHATENTSSDRAAIFYVTAGQLTFKVTVNQSVAPLYVGMFGGALVQNAGGEWAFEKPLYVQHDDESTGIAWYSNTTTTSGVTDDIDGRTNTYTLRNSSTDYYAASLCYNKNTGTTISSASDLTWYLPAQKQLMAVWVAQESFGTNKLSSADYWSSSEYNATHSWYVNFSNGLTNTNAKTNSYRVRCVRE